MEEKIRLLSLTRISFLNALVFSLLALQYIMPLSVLIMIWVLPVIFALEIFYVSPRVVFANSIGLFVVSLLLGFDVLIWTLVYFVVGLVLGFIWRAKMAIVIRFLVTGLAFTVALFGLIGLFAFIAGLRTAWWGELSTMGSSLGVFNLPPVSPLVTLTAGGIVVIMFLSVWTNSFFGKILRHLETEEPKWEKNTSNTWGKNKI